MTGGRPVLRIEGCQTPTSGQEPSMSDKPISDLRARMIADMTIRTFSDKTQRDYVRNVEAFARFLGRSPDTATGDDIRRFQFAQRIEGPGRYTTMTLDAGEFIRRFLIHVLPKGFHRIRHYGLLAGSNRAETIEDVRKLLNFAPPAADASAKAQHTGGTDPAQPLARPCPCCGGRMFVIETFEPGRQPHHRPTAPLLAIRIDTS